MGLAESDGGAGFGLAEEVLVFREFGRFVTPGPFLPTVLASHLSAAAGATEFTRSIVAGTEPVALAVPRGAADGGGCRHYDLFDAAGADWALVAESAGLALVPIGAFGARTAVDCIDPGVRLETAVAAIAATHASTAPGLWLRALVLAAAYLAGIAEAVRDMAVRHAGGREQFGRPIGTFQAIKHPCADMAIFAEAAWAQVLFAAVSVQANRVDGAFQAHAAHLSAVRAARSNASHNIQIHGGMGFTDECDAHLFLKRAEVARLQLTEPADELDTLLALPGPDAAA